MSQPRILLAVGGVLLVLAACDRRPADPPRPTVLVDAATPATAGLAGLGPSARPPHGPASDPPPNPPPNPPPRPPSAPGSAASGVAT